MLPHTGPQMFGSFHDILNRALAAFKAVGDIRFLVCFQGAVVSHQAGAESLHGFMRDRYAMSAQKVRRCLRYSLCIRDRNTVALLLHCGPWSRGLEASSYKMPAVTMLLANPIKVLRLSSFCTCSGAL